MQLANDNLNIVFSEANILEAIYFRGVKIFAAAAAAAPLFQVSLLDGAGTRHVIGGADFSRVRSNQRRDCAVQHLELTFSRAPQWGALAATVTVTLPDVSDLSEWRFQLTGIPAGYVLEYYECPILRFPDDLCARGGDGVIFHPGSEGVLIDDMELRERSEGFRGARLEYPLNGVRGYYPGTCPMQFQGYFHGGTGLYFAAHDPEHAPKGIEVVRPDEESLEMFFQVFTGAAKEEFQSCFAMILGGCGGDWQDAAEIYRAWMEKEDPSLPPKLKENPAVPQWLKDSPVVLIYPVKGRGFDTGSISGNEYFPYCNALPVVRDYAKEFQSRIMALVMHWEGTAPWAPPYVWPPYGGEEEFRRFAEALHQERNLLGVYCSGIGWTQRSSLDISYNREEEFREKGLDGVMCTGPRGEMFARVCNGEPGKGQRIGYEMCPACDFTVQTVCREVRRTIASGVDYMQYFDQNQGGSAPLCYSARHGHAPGPGLWLTKAMAELFHQADTAARIGNEEAILGCENGAAEPYIRSLPFSDLRSHLGWLYGKPVPAYGYLFHEYVNNFTGNGVCLAYWFDREKSPEFLQYRLASSFISGEVLSVVLKDHGAIHWSWVCSWEDAPPDQTLIRKLVGNLNRCRRKEGHEYLVFGRMEREIPVRCGTWKLQMRETMEREITLPVILSSHWRSGAKEALILANMNTAKEAAQIEFSAVFPGAGRMLSRTGVREFDLLCASTLEVEIPPLETLVIEWNAECTASKRR